MAWTAPRTWTDHLSEHTQANYQAHFTDNLRWIVRPVMATTAAYDNIANEEAGDLYQAGATVLGGTMGANGCVRGTLIGDFHQNAASVGTIHLALTFGGFTVWEADGGTSGFFNNAALRHIWQIRFQIANLGSTSAQFCTGALWMSKAAAGAVGLGQLGDASTGGNGPFCIPFGSDSTFAVDTTVDVPITFTASMKVAASSNITNTLSFRRWWGALEFVGQAA